MTAEVIELRDDAIGLRAFIVLDDETLGPAAGGVRTRAYADDAAALADARALARAMTIKCALAGLAAGGGKAVVLDHPGLDRTAAFRRLGDEIERLGGRFRTAGDLGTTAADLAAMGERTRYVHTDEPALAASVARGVLACARACAEPAGLRVAVQGCGSIGAAVARAFAAAGARLAVADVAPGRAAALAGELDARVVPAAEIAFADADLLAPCAVGGVIDHAVAGELRARVVCGAANNILASPAAGERLRDRGIAFVPDPIASAGAVIAGIGRTVMGLDDPAPLIDQLGATARAVLDEAAATGATPTEVALARAARILTR